MNVGESIANDQPDTTESVVDSLFSVLTTFRGPLSRPLRQDIADVAIDADRAALREQGYAIVKVGTVPSWMERASSVPFESIATGKVQTFYIKGPGE